MWGRKRKPETMSEIVDRVTRKYERRHGSGLARPLGPGEAAMMDPILLRMVAKAVADAQTRGLLIEEEGKALPAIWRDR